MRAHGGSGIGSLAAPAVPRRPQTFHYVKRSRRVIVLNGNPKVPVLSRHVDIIRLGLSEGLVVRPNTQTSGGLSLFLGVRHLLQLLDPVTKHSQYKYPRSKITTQPHWGGNVDR